MTLARDELKRFCLDALDQAAVEHPAKHQGQYATRYVLRSHSGDPIEIMFEKGPRAPANLWIDRRYAGQLLSSGIAFKEYPAAATNLIINGKPCYRRHSALAAMRRLRDADLVRFCLEAPDHIRTVVDTLIRL